MLEAHLIEAHVQLFGDQHRDRGVGPLAHLDIGHDENDAPVAPDADEGVWREGLRVGRAGFAGAERQAQAQHQAAAGGRSGLQEPAPRGAARSGGLVGVGGAENDAIVDHCKALLRSIVRRA